MARAKKEAALTPEERLQAALVPDWEWPYKLPGNWCWTTVGTICDGFQYGYTEKATFEKIGPHFIRITDIGDGIINDSGAPYCKIDSDSFIKYKINKDDILIARMGSVGENGLATHNIDGVFASYLIRIVPRSNAKYVCNFLQTNLYWGQISEKAQGTTRLNVNANVLKNLIIPLPPLAEQQRIVDRIESLFAKLDEAKEKAQAVLDSFETRKAAILHKAFTGELTAKWREEHGVGMESWEQCSISDVCTVNPKKADTKDLPDELEVSFFPMSALSEIYGEITDPQTRLLKEVRSGFTNFSEGDVVFAKITPCMENGKSAVVGKLVNDIGYGTTEFFVLRCSDRLYNRFLYHLVRDKLFRDKAKAVMAGAVGQQRVPKRYLETYKLNLPKSNEQREIVRILDGSFVKEQQTKEAAEAVLDQIDLMKKSILARAFRGELGTNDPNEERAVELLKKVLHTSAEPKSKTKRKFIPPKIEAQIKTDLERKIIMAFIQSDTAIMPIQQLMSVSSRKFDVIETLRNLQERGILLKENDTYRLMG